MLIRRATSGHILLVVMASPTLTHAITWLENDDRYTTRQPGNNNPHFYKETR